MEIQQAFDNLISRDFKDASFDDVKLLALGIWHEEFIPDVKSLNSKSARPACYLLDKLMRFNLVNINHKQSLIDTIKYLEDKFKISRVETPQQDRKIEKRALEWGLESDLKMMIRQLLPYQTRHYKHQ